LRPSDAESKNRLQESEGVGRIVPLDELLRVNILPFKMTVETMLRVAYWAQNQGSYQKAEEIIKDIHGIIINDDTVRAVTNYVGNIVFQKDCKRAETAYEQFLNGKLPYAQDKRGILYIETDGAALNTRHKNDDGSTWRENKLGVIFSSDNIHSWKDKHNDKQHRIEKREYVSFIGSCVDHYRQFKRFLHIFLIKYSLLSD
jgi:hypothetical protein